MCHGPNNELELLLDGVHGDVRFEVHQHLLHALELNKDAKIRILVKFWVYNMCHRPYNELELLLDGVHGDIRFEVHQHLLHALDLQKDAKIRILIKFWP